MFSGRHLYRCKFFTTVHIRYCLIWWWKWTSTLFFKEIVETHRHSLERMIPRRIPVSRIYIKASGFPGSKWGLCRRCLGAWGVGGIIHTCMCFAEVMCALLKLKTSFLSSRSLVSSCNYSYSWIGSWYCRRFWTLVFCIFLDFSERSLPSARVSQESSVRILQLCTGLPCSYFEDRPVVVMVGGDPGLTFEIFLVVDPTGQSTPRVASLSCFALTSARRAPTAGSPSALPHPALLAPRYPNPYQVVSSAEAAKGRVPIPPRLRVAKMQTAVLSLLAGSPSLTLGCSKVSWTFFFLPWIAT